MTGEPRVELVHGEVRLHVEAGGWVLRAGTVGPHVLWRRSGGADEADEGEAVADGVAGGHPAYDVVTLARLDLADGEVRRVVLLEVTEPVLATRLVQQSWARTGAVVRVTDLATGEARTLTRP